MKKQMQILTAVLAVVVSASSAYAGPKRPGNSSNRATESAAAKEAANTTSAGVNESGKTSRTRNKKKVVLDAKPLSVQKLLDLVGKTHSKDSKASARLVRSYQNNSGLPLAQASWETASDGNGFRKYSVKLNLRNGLRNLINTNDFVDDIKNKMQRAINGMGGTSRMEVTITDAYDGGLRPAVMIYSTDFNVTTGMRHPMRADEAAALFVALDFVLAINLPIEEDPHYPNDVSDSYVIDPNGDSRSEVNFARDYQPR